MASRTVKGITVEIGGDTTKLGKALENVEKTSKNLQNELKAVDKMLKFNPQNVELLNQKQTILNQSIEKTKEKLTMLKQAEEQVIQQFERGEASEEQVRALKREIINATDELEKMEHESENTSNELERLENGADEATEGLEDLEDGAEDAGEQLDDLSDRAEDSGSRLEGVAGTFSKIGESLKTAGEKVKQVGDKVIDVGKKVAGDAMDYEDAMAKLSTIADTSEVSLADLSNSIMDLSNETGIAATDIADNVYNAISAGQKTGDAVNFVSNATKLAKAGFTDSESALDILTTTLNAYGMEAGEVTRVSDVLIQTQNLGKTTVGELASSMGKIIPTAKGCGVELEQVAAGYAIMTANGIATAESTTYMNSMLNELNKSGTGVSKILKDQTGKSFSELMASGMSLSEVLDIVNKGAEKQGKKFTDVWSSSEAAKAGVVLLGDSSAKFNGVLKEMNASTGATDEAFGKLDTNSQRAQIAMNKLQNAGIELGTVLLETLAPVFEKLTEILDDLITWFNGLDDKFKTMIVVAGLVIAALGPILIIFGNICTGISSIITVVSTLLPILTGPVGIIIAIGAVITILITMYNKCEWFRDGVDAVIKFILNCFNGLVNFIKGGWQDLLTLIAKPFKNAFNEVKKKCDEFKSKIDTFVSNVKNTMKKGVDNIESTWKTLPSKLWNGIKGAIDKVGTWGTNIVNKAKTSASNMVNGVINNVKTMPGKIQSQLSSALNKVTSWGTNIKNKATTAAKNMVNGVINNVKTMPGKIQSQLSSALNKVTSWGTNMKNKASTAAKNTVTAVVNGFKQLPNKVKSIGSDAIKGLWNGMEGMKSWVSDKVSGFAGGIVDSMKSKLGIHSPSTVFRDQVGKYIAEGITVGINNNANSPVSALENITGNMLDSLNELDGTNVSVKTQASTAQMQSLMNNMNLSIKELSNQLNQLISSNKNLSIVLDTGVLVGQTVAKMDKSLATVYALKERGV